MGFVISTILLRGTNRESHGQNSSTLQKFEKSSQNTLPPYLQLAVGLSTNVYTTTPMLTNQNDTRETPENTLCVYQRHARILFACISCVQSAAVGLSTIVVTLACLSCDILVHAKSILACEIHAKSILACL